MSKSAKQAYIILTIVFALFCVIAFAVPTAKTPSFWIAFIFTVVAFAAQIMIWKTTFSKAETLKSKFLGLPIIHIGLVYFVIQLIAFAVFMAFQALPMWTPLVVCALILGISAVCLIAVKVGKDEVFRIDNNTNKKVSFIQKILVDIEMLINSENNTEVKAALNALGEEVRYSDPMSIDSLENLEETMIDKTASLKTAENKMPIINELTSLLIERNRKIRILK